MGGDELDYHNDDGSSTANILETKIMINSTILDTYYRVRFTCANIKDHFLETPMKIPEYMRVKHKYIPLDILLKYNLSNKVTPDSYICKDIEGYARSKACSHLSISVLKKLL